MRIVRSRVVIGGGMFAAACVAAACRSGPKAPPPSPAPTPSAGTTNQASPVKQAVATNDKPTPPPPPPAPPPDPAAWRPAWWTESVRATSESLSVGAMADDGELAAARRKALDEAMFRLKQALDKEPSDPVTKVDSIRLPDGRYRAFVQATARLR